MSSRKYIWIDPELHDALKAESVSTGKTVKRIANDALREGIKFCFEKSASAEKRKCPARRKVDGGGE